MCAGGCREPRRIGTRVAAGSGRRCCTGAFLPAGLFGGSMLFESTLAVPFFKADKAETPVPGSDTGVLGGRGWIARAALLKTAHWAVFALSSATAPQLFESTLGYALKSFGQKKNSSIFTTLEFLVGAGGFEPPKLKSSRFTVCPHWPLGNTPIFFCCASVCRTTCLF